MNGLGLPLYWLMLMMFDVSRLAYVILFHMSNLLLLYIINLLVLMLMPVRIGILMLPGG